jgi:hypothetical protein
MWKGIYYAETGDRCIQAESKARGNLRIRGPFGMKIWDDDGVVCVIKNALIEKMQTAPAMITEVMEALCSEDGQLLILALGDQKTHPKEQLLSETGLELYRLNELLLLFSVSCFVFRNYLDCKPTFILTKFFGIKRKLPRTRVSFYLSDCSLMYFF